MLSYYSYCDPSYSFPPQSETIEFCASVAANAIKQNAKTLIVVGTYTIGKEKIFTGICFSFSFCWLLWISLLQFSPI